jgi:hypothetical protein
MTVRLKSMRRVFGLWLLTCPRSFKDPRIWGEDRRSYAVQTPFQRAAGVRYIGRSQPRFPDSFTGFGSFVRGSRPRSVVCAFNGWFSHPLRPQHLSLTAGHLTVLRRATGYAMISSRHLRCVSLHNAHFVGILRVRDEDAT